ncbi:MAG: hypothetical protein Q7T54_00555 [Candidatus Levybacteria bacterium]|nr:hypothetical protein [Candidatus Levybacteria bacterium]
MDKDRGLVPYSESIVVPTWIKVNIGQFSQQLGTEVAMREVDSEDFQNVLFELGFQMIGMGERERMALRTGTGYEENIDFFDPKFTIRKPGYKINEMPKLATLFLDEKRLNLARPIAQTRDELQILGGRMLNVGLYVAEEMRINGKKLLYYTENDVIGMDLDLTTRNLTKMRIQKHLESLDKNNAS